MNWFNKKQNIEVGEEQKGEEQKVDPEVVISQIKKIKELGGSVKLFKLGNINVHRDSWSQIVLMPGWSIKTTEYMLDKHIKFLEDRPWIKGLE